MDISFDPAKRDKTLAERGLDFADAGLVFAGVTATVQDKRRNHGEDRYITIGQLRGSSRRSGLDGTWRHKAHNVDEVCTCERRSAAVRPAGLIPTRHRN
jgi:hypothetical protein